MSVFDYIEKELDRIEVGYTSYDGTKITMSMDEVRELVQNIKKKYKADGDVIYRQDAIDALNSKRVSEDNGRMWREYRNANVNMAIEIIQSLPSAQPELKWISVNDQLPEEGSPVLLLYINEEIGLSESCRPKSWNQLTDNTIVGWFPIPKETKING